MKCVEEFSSALYFRYVKKKKKKEVISLYFNQQIIDITVVIVRFSRPKTKQKKNVYEKKKKPATGKLKQKECKINSSMNFTTSKEKHKS